MANKDAAFGLKAIGKVGQNRDNQGLSEYSIAASASAIYQNDPVEMLDTGTIGVAAAGDVLLGSLNGVFYTDASTSKPTWANHLEASNTATDIVGFVADDPYERFEVQSAGTVAQTNIGNCADIVYAIGSSPNYVSKVEISGTMAATAAQLKIVGVSKDPDNSELGAANANVIVTINEHFLKQTAGI
jgi:ligand-binding sensor domain-containing protein